VLNEYAIVFYSLLNQSLQIDAIEQFKQIEAASYPFMEKADRQNILSGLERQSSDIIELLDQENTAEGLTRLKKIFGQND